MKKLEPYVYFKKDANITVFEFSLERGEYVRIGEYDTFIEGRGYIILKDNNSSYFTAIFTTSQSLCRAVKGNFVGFDKGLIYFEDEQKNLCSLASDRTVTKVAKPSQAFAGKWEKDNHIFSFEKYKLMIQDLS